ncbi:hypothetical protein SFRURICE_017097 [Spodoptera frugiperda]|nr:hypothetical protein SFRURICE_017097 [Spodoptera frugiperda]
MNARLKKYSKLNHIPFMIQRRSTTIPNGVLLGNKVGEDLQTVLKPVNLMQKILFCAKYSIRNNVITAKSYLYIILRIIIVFLFRCISVDFEFISFKSLENDLRMLYTFLCCSTDIILYVTGDFLDSLSIISHSRHNILLVLNIQYLFNVLQIKGEELKSLVFCSWVYIIILNMFSISYILFYIFVSLNWSVIEVIMAYMTIVFDVNIVNALILLKLIRHIIRTWIRRVENSRSVGRLEHGELRTILDCYQTIQESYIIIVKVFRLMIVYYTVFTAYLSLRNVALVLLLQKLVVTGELKSILLPLLSQIWNWKNIIMLICLSVECEKFYTAMKSEDKICKNILRLQKTSYKKMSACGLFSVDATLPLQLSSFITSYTIIFLQFAYL